MNFFKSSFFPDVRFPRAPQPLASAAEAAEQQHQISDAESEQDQLTNPDDQNEKDVVDRHEIAEQQHQISDAESEPDQLTNSDDQNEKDVVDKHEIGQPVDVWNFGNLVKSLTSKSEKVLQAYRRDLQDFGYGLKKETEVFKEVAAHAVKDLPNSLEVGASLAQESLETVGQAIEEFGTSVWKETTEILAQGKDVALKINEDHSSETVSGAIRYSSPSILAGRYSRFEAQVNAMQHDSTTYCDEPEDEEDYKTWRLNFSLAEKKEEIESVLNETLFVRELQLRIVPRVLDYETFWTRYFYRLNKLQQAEAARVHLVKRAAAAEEEDLGWDLDEGIEDEGGNGTEKGIDDVQGKVKETFEVAKEDNELKGEFEAEVVGDKAGISEGKAWIKGSGPPSDVAQYNSNIDDKGEEEVDSSWEVAEEAEDLSGSEGRKSSNSETSWEVPEGARPDVRKRFNAMEEEEDLSWDVDDEDEETKP